MFSLKDEISVLFEKYISLPTITNSEKENLVDDFLQSYFLSFSYFQENRKFFSSELIPDDPHNRSVHWALVKGEGAETVVLMHHFDVVTEEPYHGLKDLAFVPSALEKQMKMKSSLLKSDAAIDLKSGRWIFGRGAADMKAGGAIQLSLLKQFSEQNERKGNLLLIAVPDEENLSAGMRFGVSILGRLKRKHDLDFRLMINSEPHQRQNEETGIVHQGSIAKMNWFVHVQGVLTHAGNVLSGVNPWSLMGRIVARTDLEKRFVDRVGDEVGVPPTWVHIQDSKDHYDISTPDSLIGYFNVLNFKITPKVVGEMLMDCCREAAGEFYSKSLTTQFHLNGFIVKPQPINVIAYKALLEQLEAMGENRMARYRSHEKLMAEKLKLGQISFMEATAQLVDLAVTLSEPKAALIVVGMMMPYYPGVSNAVWEKPLDFHPIIAEKAMSSWGQMYENRNYFTGICDLSYASYVGDVESMETMMENMPLWGKYYRIPFKELAEIRMPCINVGPWGKDLHQIGERVYREDLLERTPKLIDHLIQHVLQNKV